MICRYCIQYAEAKRRMSSDSSDKKRRLCATTKAWKNEYDECCGDFTPCNTFWCDRLQQRMAPSACRNKRVKKLARECKHCSQYHDIMDVIRSRTHKPITAEPIRVPLLRRRKLGTENT